MYRWIWVLIATLALTACAGAQPAAVHTNPPPPPLEATPEPGVDYIAIIGDGFSVGSKGSGGDPDAWPSLIRPLLHRQGHVVQASTSAASSYGYIPRGPEGRKFHDIAPRVVGKNTDVVVLFGAARDKTMLPDGARLASLVSLTMQRVQDLAPNARLLVIGPAVMGPQPPNDILQVRDIVREQAQAHRATFVDPLAEGWFTSQELANDKGRPNAAGQILLAEKIAPLIAGQLAGAPTPPS